MVEVDETHTIFAERAPPTDDRPHTALLVRIAEPRPGRSAHDAHRTWCIVDGVRRPGSTVAEASPAQNAVSSRTRGSTGRCFHRSSADETKWRYHDPGQRPMTAALSTLTSSVRSGRSGRDLVQSFSEVSRRMSFVRAG